MPAAYGAGDEHVVIAILDGPVNPGHPGLRGAKLIRLQSLVPHEAGDGPATAHGTHVASVIFGQPGSGVEGVAPRCTGLTIPIFSDAQAGTRLACSQLDLARAILLAIDHGAHIINISGGQLATSAEPDAMLAQAIETCARRNVLVVAAAGNDGCDCLHVPAAIETVLAVGAMDADGQALASSNWGASYRAQGILAPGLDVLGADATDGVVRRSGTSFAAPFVSGIAALLLSRQIALGREPDPHAVRAALLQSASPCVAGQDADCRRILSGRIDVDAAFKLVTGGVHHMSDTAAFLPDAMMPGSIKPGLIGPSEAMPSIEPAWSVGLARDAPERGIRMSEDAGFARVQPSADAPPLPQARSDIGQIAPSCGGDKPCGCGGEKPGGCGCGGHAAPQKTQLVYALGRIGCDFGSEARRDSFMQAMGIERGRSFTEIGLVEHFAADPSEAQGVIWTLNLDATPIYAIQPAGAFAALGYERLRDFFDGSLRRGVELVSVPGVISGNVRLQSGQVVPIIVPAVRGMFEWSTDALVRHVLGEPPEQARDRDAYNGHVQGLTDLLNRIYYDFRNLGLSPEDRAMNYSATNLVQLAEVIRKTTIEGLDLDTLRVKRSPICRPDSECYDVEATFFNPDNTNVASRIHRLTVDVSDVIPVGLGATRSWTRR